MATLLNLSLLEAISTISSIGLSVCAMLAIGFDCKAKKVSSRTTYMVLAFFFPIIVSIVYLCKRSKYNLLSEEQEIPNKQKMLKSSKICAIIAILCLVANITASSVLAVKSVKEFMDSGIIEDIIGGEELDFDLDENVEIRYGYQLDGKTVYYDMKGNSYDISFDVPLYDRDGMKYTYSIDEDYNESYVSDNGDSYDYYVLYLDLDGYIVIDEDMKIDLVENGDYLEYADKEGNVYYSVYEISWDADGNMVDTYNGELK